MVKKTKLSPSEKRLVRRYLIWCYKTTKESLDRVDRYYTQNRVDNFILGELKKVRGQNDKKWGSLVADFEQYAIDKLHNADKQKFSGQHRQELSDDYLYLKQRFLAIEKAIVAFLGKKELAAITEDYEREMTTRIWQAREH